MSNTATKIQQTISPINNQIYVEREYSTSSDVELLITKAQAAQRQINQLSIKQRAEICEKMVCYFEKNRNDIASEITHQMGRPISQSGGEINGLAERARYMISIAEQNLQPSQLGNGRSIQHEPLGVILVLAPWNYPYLTAINTIVPAIMAGNSVLLKHSSQTPLCAERFQQAFAEAGLPEGGLQCLHLTHDQTNTLIKHNAISFVAFTGSVVGGQSVQQAASSRFIGVGLELGGKDPAYVRSDADINHAIEQLVDGAFYNSGQSCCGVERIYVQQDIFDQFVTSYVEQVNKYRLDNPLLEQTNLGPMVRNQAAAYVRQQIQQAVQMGAQTHINPQNFNHNDPNTAYLAPQVLTQVNHNMSIMQDETFGPAVGIMSVDNDQQAIKLMNDSEFGLTASVWTRDEQAAIAIGNQVETGTFFMNRCDYLDPTLAWTGVKNSGRGCTLSSLGYAQLTRPKSFNFKK